MITYETHAKRNSMEKFLKKGFLKFHVYNTFYKSKICLTYETKGVSMNKIEIILRELSHKEKVIDAKELKEICKKYEFKYLETKKLLLITKSIVPIFRGIYYIKDYNEKKTSSLKYAPIELVAEGLRKKGINWYFGLHTAIKMLGLTHEVYTVRYILNDSYTRSKSLKVAGSNFIFKKIKPSLFFGIKKRKTDNKIVINYSNLEKTILDFIYFYKKKGKSDRAVLGVLREYDEHLNIDKLLRYAKGYPTSVKRIVKGVLGG